MTIRRIDDQELLQVTDLSVTEVTLDGKVTLNHTPHGVETFMGKFKIQLIHPRIYLYNTHVALLTTPS